MNRITTFDIATISVLIRRDLKRFFRQKSRVAGALIQPLLFWLILGTGFGRSFQHSLSSPVSFLEFFYPGIIAMIVLFTSIFATMSVIEDRNEGFLQGVLTAPSSRASLVLGKTLAGSLLAFIQVLLFLLFLPLAGIHFFEVNFASLFIIIFLTAFFLNAFGFFLAWWLNSVQGYHVMMSVLLMPLWLLSGAVFPLENSSRLLRFIASLNPLTYAVEGIRKSFYGGKLPHSSAFILQMGIILVMCLITYYLALYQTQKKAV